MQATTKLVKSIIVYDTFQYQCSHLTTRPSVVIVSLQLIVGNKTLGVQWRSQDFGWGGGWGGGGGRGGGGVGGGGMGGGGGSVSTAVGCSHVTV